MIKRKEGPFENPASARTPTGFATFGRCAESSTGAESKAVPTANQTKPTTVSLATHRHRLVRSFPSGNSRKMKINAPIAGFPIQFCSHAAHRTHPFRETPASRARIAMRAASPEIATRGAMNSISHPMGFAGRREAMSAPSAPSVAARTRLPTGPAPTEPIVALSNHRSTRHAATIA